LNSITSADSSFPARDERGHDLPRAGHRASGRWALIAFPVVTVVLALSPAIKLLVFFFPVMAVLLAAYLYRRNLPGYVSLVCWLWFLTPLVRRVLDFRVPGWTQPTPVQLAPPLAVCVPLVWLMADWRRVMQRRAAPLLCILAVCIYATFLGLLNFAPRLVFQDLLTWVAPLIFAFTLCWHSDRAIELFQAFEKSFLYGLLVIGAYGVVQFFFLPSWDAFWMRWVNMDSIGNPEPKEVRVFSTMNGPQILASFLAVGLIIAFSSRHRIRFVAIPLGLLCLVLSLARSGWVAAVAGTLYLLWHLPHRQRFRLVVVGIVAAVVMIGALQNPDLQEVMSQRFQTLTDVKNDTSFMDRVDSYRALFAGFMDNPFGLGMGATPAAAEATSQRFVHGGWAGDLGDSTVAMIMTTMGLAGGLVLAGSLIVLGRHLFVGASVEVAYTRTMRAVFIAMVAEAALDGVISGPTGFLTWASIAFCIALGVADNETQPAMQTISAAA
jgi:hypothetical protein